MPELAEVEFFRKQWDVGLGQHVQRVLLHRDKRIFRYTNASALVRGITGRRFENSSARGKRILLQFSGRHWLGIHLGMSGKMRAEPVKFRRDKHDHLALVMHNTTLVLRDSRLFGSVQYHQGENPPPWWPLHVPEIGSRTYHRQFFDAFLRRHARAPIKSVLLMQEGFSGIGNWMADEILWRAHVHPACRTGELLAKDRARLYLQTRFVARESLRTIGRDWTEPPRTWLIHERWRADGLCPRHKRPLARASIGGRTTAWCPKCQGPIG